MCLDWYADYLDSGEDVARSSIMIFKDDEQSRYRTHRSPTLLFSSPRTSLPPWFLEL